jgi:taurine dioxygenase
MEGTTIEAVRVTPLFPVGAEIHGIDLAREVDEPVRARLNQAFVDHSVIVVRGQSLTAPQMAQAMSLFGELFPQHNERYLVPGCPIVHYISNEETLASGKRYIAGEGYHTDHSNHAVPPKATVLHAVKLPSKGGDTQFVDMYRAYEELPDATKRRIEGRRAIHVYQSSHSTRQLPQLGKAEHYTVPDAVLHPLVRTHPQSRRRALYINPIRIEGIVGMDDREALPLLDELLEHSTQERFQYRHVWSPGDLVMWDNRCLMHKANGDYDMNEVRYLYRLMLKGEPLIN